MEDPIYHLEGIVRTKDEAEDFEGPLNLILLLLSKNKIEIRDVSISALLDQYLQYLDEMAAMDMEIASEFIAMASHLMYIKTKVLLSEEEAVSELEELLSSLEGLKAKDVYGQIQGITPQMADMFRRGAGLLEKPAEPLPVEKEYKYRHDMGDLLKALARIMDRESSAQLTQQRIFIPRRIIYSIDKKTQELTARLQGGGPISVQALFHSCVNRSERVATLLVLLELCKNGKILFSGLDDDMTVTYCSTPETDQIGDEQDGTE